MENKANNTSYYIAAGIAIIVIACFLFLYFIQFSGPLSNDSNDWSSFGTYFGSISMFVLTALNIFVFIKLTKAINCSDEKNKKKELTYQKKLLLAQMRQKELNDFVDIINNALIIKEDTNISNIPSPAIFAFTYVSSFIKIKENLFPIIGKFYLKEKLECLRILLKDYSSLLINSFSNRQSYLNNERTNNLYKEKVLKIIDCKDEILFTLQEYTLEALND